MPQVIPFQEVIKQNKEQLKEFIFNFQRKDAGPIFMGLVGQILSNFIALSISAKFILSVQQFKAMMMDRDSEIGIGEFRSFKNSDCNSDCLGFKNFINPYMSCASSDGPSDRRSLEEQLFLENHEEDGQQYYKLLFSPEKAANSLIKINQHIEMKCLDNDDSQPGEDYKNRNRKVSNLKNKQMEQLSILKTIKQNQASQYKAMVAFMKVFASIKNQLVKVRSDYYSNKTFNALKNTPEEKLKAATRVAYSMLKQIMAFSRFSQPSDLEENDERLVQFLVIPRFLISKEKVIKFAQDQILQNNFKLLVYTGCLGHYNNEANKKFPEEKYMEYVRSLLIHKNGKQKYKKICSINHGGKFITRNKDEYFNLFKKSLQGLKRIEEELKKKKKPIVKIIDDLPAYSQQIQIDYELERKIKIFEKGYHSEGLSELKEEYIQDNCSQFINSEFKLGDRQPQMTKTSSHANMLPGKNIGRLFMKGQRSISLPVNTEPLYPKEEQQCVQEKPKKKSFIKRTFTLVPPQAIINQQKELSENQQ